MISLKTILVMVVIVAIATTAALSNTKKSNATSVRCSSDVGCRGYKCVKGACANECTSDSKCADGYKCKTKICAMTFVETKQKTCKNNSQCKADEQCFNNGYNTRCIPQTIVD